MAITQKVLAHRFLTRHTNKTYKVNNIECNKNPPTCLKEEYFKKRYEIPLHNMKKCTAGFTSQSKDL